MGPPPDNCRQAYRGSCLDPRPQALFIISDAIGLPHSGNAGSGETCPRDPRAAADAWLAAAGFRDPTEARASFDLPKGRRLVIGWDGLDANQRPPRLVDEDYPATLSPTECVQAALILSLCSTHLYDDEGPLIWTNHRLRRLVRLGQSRRFHEPG